MKKRVAPKTSSGLLKVKKKPLKKGMLKKVPKRKVGTSTGSAIPLVMMLYGPPGIGKTSLAAHANNVCFITDPHEDGIVRLPHAGQCPVPNEHIIVPAWTDLIRAITHASKTHNTIVLDSLTGMQQLCFAHCCKKDYKDNWSSKGFYSYQQGPSTAATRYWEPEFIQALQHAFEKGTSIYLLAHSEMKQIDDPVNEGYNHYQPYLHKQLWQFTKRWCHNVIFYNHAVSMKKSEGFDKKKRPDLSTERRAFHTTHSIAYEAKNWPNMRPVLNAGPSASESHKLLLAEYNKCLTR